MKDALLATVIDEYATVEAFASLLAYEEKALAAVSPLESLPAIVETKTELTEQLASLERTRDAQLRELGFPPGRKGIELAAAADARLAEHWKLLQAVVERARRANTNNGVMIRIRMNYNQSALAILRGATEKASVYGPDGRMAGLR
jgi:flagellar biosynthesis protein FlgN